MVDEPGSTTVQPGPTLVSERFVHWEYWAVDTLAQALCRNTTVLPWLAPKLHPLVRLEDQQLNVSSHLTPLSPDLLKLLYACDGKMPAHAIATLLARDSRTTFRSPGHVLNTLYTLVKRQIIVWNPTVPVQLFPEQALQQQLKSIDEPSIRAPLLNALAQLQTAKKAVTQAQGNPDALATAMDQLDQAFTQTTKTEPTRRAGQTYAGRTLIYEDCRRNVEVRFSKDLLQRLAPHLNPCARRSRMVHRCISNSI